MKRKPWVMKLIQLNRYYSKAIVMWEKKTFPQAGLFEGDIANVTVESLRLLRSGDYTRNAIRELWKKWPGGTIPYIISSSFSSYERRVIASAIQQYHTKTCIRCLRCAKLWNMAL